MNKIWTIGAILQWTQEYFAQKGIDTPRLDAEILLSHVLQKERIFLYAHYDQPLNPEELAAYRNMVKKRAGRLSVAHILGTKAFMGLDFHVTRDVLIPRPETELLVEAMLELGKANPPSSILDIGTGSGAIILSLLQYLPEAVGTGVDISPKALAVATENGSALGLADRVTWVEGNICSSLPPQTFDWIVSNPPYLTQDDMAQLQPEVRYDPPQALFGGPDGLDAYRHIAEQTPAFIRPGGYCAVEIGAGQAEDVIHIFEDTRSYLHVKTVTDYGGIERVILFIRKEQM